MYEISNDSEGRLYRVRMSGSVPPDEMAKAAQEMMRLTDTYRGEPHMCLVDLRGLLVLSAESVQLLMESIVYTERRGVVLCAHVSDETVARLGELKVSNQPSPHNRIATDCVSVEEAERILVDYRAKHFAPRA